MNKIIKRRSSNKIRDNAVHAQCCHSPPIPFLTMIVWWYRTPALTVACVRARARVTAAAGSIVHVNNVTDWQLCFFRKLHLPLMLIHLCVTPTTQLYARRIFRTFKQGKRLSTVTLGAGQTNLLCVVFYVLCVCTTHLDPSTYSCVFQNIILKPRRYST